MNTTQNWTAKITSEGETDQQANGESPFDAVANLLGAIMDEYRRGDACICADYIIEIGQAMQALENDSCENEFESQCGDFIQPWKLVVTRNADEPCDQIGGGCTCESCTAQIVDAIGGIPIDLDTHEFTDDCERIN